jgi:Glycosyl transferase family 2
MKIRVVSHVNGDDDLLDSWFAYYMGLGVSSFHLIVHGSPKENQRLYEVKDSFPVVIEESYEDPFDSREKKRRLDLLLQRLRGQWLILADSDEFVEFPYRSLQSTIFMLELARKTALFCPMIQHLTIDGLLDTPAVIADPFDTFPLCSIDLYQKMGVQGSIDKYPLFYCTDRARLSDGGNHNSPTDRPTTAMQGATHHFKFRRHVSQRLHRRIDSAHPWRHESAQFQQYLAAHGNKLPVEDSFAYSRHELFRRRLLRKYTLASGIDFLHRRIGNRLLSSPGS